MLTCPRCQTALKCDKHKNGLHYICDKCKGSAVSLSVLRRNAAPQAVNALWAKVFEPSARLDGLLCPNCSSKLTAIDLQPELTVDICRQCHFLWFDPSELEQIPQKPPPKPDPIDELPQEVREQLAIRQVERMAEQQEAEGPAETWQWLPALLGMPVEQSRQLRYYKPWITWSLALACIVVAILTWKDLDGAAHAYGYIPADAIQRFGLTSLTSFFLHGGIWHLVGNLYFLIVFGDNVEAALGRWKYLLLIVAATITAAVFHGLFDNNPSLPLIGASGGISGVIAAYALLFPKARLGFIFGVNYYFKWFVIPSTVALFLWFTLQAFATYKQLAGFSNVSALAHLGGALVGVVFFLAIWIQRRRLVAK